MQWIPGYWAWDDDGLGLYLGKRFLGVSAAWAAVASRPLATGGQRLAVVPRNLERVGPYQCGILAPAA